MEIRLPNLGEDVDSGTVASIFVKKGDVIEKDQSLIELESEKAIAEIRAGAVKSVTAVAKDAAKEIVSAMGGKADAKAVTAAVTARMKG